MSKKNYLTENGFYDKNYISPIPTICFESYKTLKGETHKLTPHQIVLLATIIRLCGMHKDLVCTYDAKTLALYAGINYYTAKDALKILDDDLWINKQTTFIGKEVGRRTKIYLGKWFWENNKKSETTPNAEPEKEVKAEETPVPEKDTDPKPVKPKKLSGTDLASMSEAEKIGYKEKYKLDYQKYETNTIAWEERHDN
jgi:hypothetical protein